LVAAARYWVNLAWQARGSEQFQRLIVEQENEIGYQFGRLGNSLGPVADHWRANGDLDRDDLQTFYALMSNEGVFSSLRGIGVIVADPLSGGELLIDTIEPVDSNIGLSGADITQMPALAEAAAAARETSQPQLVRGENSDPAGGFFLIQPVDGLADEQGAQAIEVRQDAFLGWLIAPIDVGKFFEASNVLYRSELGITAYADAETPTYSTVQVSGANGEAEHEPMFVDTIEMDLFGLGWKIESYSLPDLERLAAYPVRTAPQPAATS